jgi:hypothetical protein
MNVVGKILVILNLLMALVTGAFLVIDFATRTNWKNYAESLKRELDVARHNNSATVGTQDELKKQAKDLQTQLDAERQARVDDKKKADADRAEANLRADEAERVRKELEVTAKNAQLQVARLQEEIKGRDEVLKKRDQMILTLQDEGRKYRADYLAYKGKADALQARNEQLLAQFTEVQRKILEKETGADLLASADPNRPNPPTVYVRGSIDRVDPQDGTLVEINVGSDQGLKKYNTLEVFRIKPAQYLGTIRIMEVYHHKAIGRLVRNPYLQARAQLRQGDQVASKIGGP